MGSYTPLLCFSVCAAAEENLYVYAEEVSELLGRKIDSFRPSSVTYANLLFDEIYHNSHDLWMEILEILHGPNLILLHNSNDRFCRFS